MKYIKYMWKKNIEPKIFDKKKCFQSQLNFIIESNKQKYYSDLSTKLADPITSTKSYWSTLKMFLNDEIFLVFHIQVTKI